MADISVFAFQFLEICVSPLIRQRNFFDHFLHLSRQFFFPQKASLRTLLSAAFESTVVVVIDQPTFLDFSFGSYCIAALTAYREPFVQQTFFSSLFAGFSIGDKCLLDFVKKFL